MASTNRDEISRLELLHAAHPDGLVFPHLADAYRRAGRYAQAESVLNAGLRRHSDYSSAHVVLGRLRLDQGKRREAENSFQRVLQLDPENSIALEFLGRLASEEGRTQEALSYLRRLARLKPSDGLHEQIEELEARAREARRSTDEGGGGGSSAENGGGDGRAAVAESTQASEPAVAASDDDLDPELPEPGEVVTETMAELYARQGLHERAEAVYRALLRRDPSNARLRARLDEATARLRADPERAPAEPDVVDEWPGRAHGAETGPAAEVHPEADEWVDVPEDVAPTPEDADATGGWTPLDALGEPEEAAPSEPAPVADRSIRDYLTETLAWSPDAEARTGRTDEQSRDRADDDTREPWAETPVTSAGEPAPREPAIGSDLAAGSPWSTGGSEAQSAGEERSAADDRSPTEDRAAVGVQVGRSRSRSRSGPTPTAEELGLVEYELEGAEPATRALIALTDMLVGLLEYRDPFFRGSSSLTRLLAMNVAEEMGFDITDRVNLALAAVLRDLGRLAMGGRLVEVQKTPTREARRKIERHVDLALQLLEGIDLPRPVRLAVRHHHERWDGDGYPDGLAGTDIPFLARVLSVVDSFAAMISPRPYRLPRKVADAVQELEEASGSQYDPQAVDAILRVLDRREQPRLGFVQRHHILLVNPDQPGAVVTASKLCTAGYLAEVSGGVDAARERLRRVPVAALVVSAESGRDELLDLIRDLRMDPLFASLPIVVVEAETVELRVRLLEGGADVCFPPGISYGELQGTLGALVRRTVRSRETGADPSDGEAPWLALQGDIQDFPLAWLLQVMKYDSRTAGVGIRTSTAQGAIYLEGGDAVHAQIRGGKRGEEALKEMLQWNEGRFTVQPDARPRERSIESSIMHLLLTQAVEEDHEAAGIFGAVSG